MAHRCLYRRYRALKRPKKRIEVAIESPAVDDRLKAQKQLIRHLSSELEEETARHAKSAAELQNSLKEVQNELEDSKNQCLTLQLRAEAAERRLNMQSSVDSKAQSYEAAAHAKALKADYERALAEKSSIETQLEEERATSREQILALKEENEALQQEQRASADAHSLQLEKQRTEALAQVEAIKAEYQHALAEKSLAVTRLVEAENASAEKLLAMERNQSSLKESVSGQLSRVENERDAALARVDAMRAECEHALAEKSLAKKQLEEARQASAEKLLAVQLEGNKIQSAMKESASRQLVSVEKERDVAVAQVDETRAECKHAREEKEIAEKLLEEKSAEFMEKLAQLQRSHEEMRANLTDAAEAKLSQQSKVCKEAMSRTELLEKEREALVEKLSALQNRCNITDKEAEAQREHFQNRINSLESQLETKSKELEERSVTLKRRIAEISSLENTCTSQSEAHASAMSGMEATLKEYASKIQSLEARCSELVQESASTDNYREKYEELYSELTCLRGENASLESRAAECEDLRSCLHGPK